MDLSQARKELDGIDRELASLFIRRLEIVREIAAYKSSVGMSIYQPEREKEVISRLLDRTDEKFHSDLTALYDRIFDISRALQARANAE